MRLPLFNKAGEPPTEGQSLMAYYSKLFELSLSDFPNPGTPHVRSTGIYLQEGKLEDQPEPQMLIWKNPEGHTPPPGEKLSGIYKKMAPFRRPNDRYRGTNIWNFRLGVYMGSYRCTLSKPSLP